MNENLAGQFMEGDYVVVRHMVISVNDEDVTKIGQSGLVTYYDTDNAFALYYTKVVALCYTHRQNKLTFTLPLISF